MEFLSSTIKSIIMWSIVGAAAGLASFLNKVLNDDNTSFEAAKFIMRGFIGCVVGMTSAWIVNQWWGGDWAFPAASFGGWFSTETMNILQKWASHKIGRDGK